MMSNLSYEIRLLTDEDFNCTELLDDTNCLPCCWEAQLDSGGKSFVYGFCSFGKLRKSGFYDTGVMGGCRYRHRAWTMRPSKELADSTPWDIDFPTGCKDAINCRD